METLKKRADFLRLRGGRKWVMPGLVVQMAPKPDKSVADHASAVRVGYTVTKRVGNAVVRNRVKRRLRAVAEQVLRKMGQSGHDYVLIGREGTISRPFESLLDDLEGALIKLHTSQRRRRDP